MVAGSRFLSWEWEPEQASFFENLNRIKLPFISTGAGSSFLLWELEPDQTSFFENRNRIKRPFLKTEVTEAGLGILFLGQEPDKSSLFLELEPDKTSFLRIETGSCFLLWALEPDQAFFYGNWSRIKLLFFESWNRIKITFLKTEIFLSWSRIRLPFCRTGTW